MLVFLALSIALITLDFRQGPGGPLDSVKDVAVSIVTPVQRGFTTLTRPIGNFFSSLGDLSQLREENDRLEDELERAEQAVAEAEILIQENIKMADALDVARSYPAMKREVAEVIAEGVSNYRWAVTIGKGENDGIKPNMAVITGDGLVGRVVRSYPDTAEVLLLVDPDAAARARVEDEGDRGTISGNGADETLSLDYINTDTKVEPGDRVYTAGYDGGIFPPGIPIGDVEEAGGAGGALQKRIRVEPFVDFEQLDYVLVLLDTGAKVENAGRSARKAERS